MLFSPEERASFQDSNAYLRYRKELEDNFFRGFDSQLIGSESSQNATKNFIEMMRKRLVSRPELLQNLIPDFAPHCRRLTPVRRTGQMQPCFFEYLVLTDLPRDLVT